MQEKIKEIHNKFLARVNSETSDIFETAEKWTETHIRELVYIAGYADVIKDVLKILEQKQED